MLFKHHLSQARSNSVLHETANRTVTWKKGIMLRSHNSVLRSTANAVPLELRVQIPSSASLDAQIGASQFSNKTKNSQKIENSTLKNQKLSELKSIYFKTKNEYKVYTFKKFSRSYAVSVVNTLTKIFEEIGANTIEEIKRAIALEKVNKRQGGISIRVWLNYLEEFEILDLDVIENIRKRIKIHQETHIDTYIPNEIDVKKSIKEISKYDRLHYLLYRFYIETTARTTEVRHFFENFDEKNIEIHENGIVTYNNFYLRSQKSSYYLFFTLELYNELKEYIGKLDRKYFNRFVDRTQDNKQIVHLKYLRKYSFTLMVKAGVSIEIANFISGRSTSKNIGMTHYLNKKEIALQEYEKVLELIKY